MTYDYFYHKIIQPLAIVNIVDRYNDSIYKGYACYITDFAWKEVQTKQLIMASVDLDTKEMIVMLDMDFFKDRKKPVRKAKSGAD